MKLKCAEMIPTQHKRAVKQTLFCYGNEEARGACSIYLTECDGDMCENKLIKSTAKQNQLGCPL